MRVNGIVRSLGCCALFAALQGCGGNISSGEERLEGASPEPEILICLLCPQPVTLVSGVNPSSIALDDTYLYFTNAASLPYELDRAPLAGGAKTVLASNNAAMSSLIRFGTVLYWADLSGSSSAGGVWQMSTPSGTAFQVSHHPSDAFSARQAVAVYQPTSSQILITTRHVLFASVLDAAIWDHRSLLFSSSEVSLLPPTDPVTHLNYYPYSMVIDQSRVYFTHDGSLGLWSAPLTGGAATALVAANVNRDSLAIASGQLYFQKGADLVTMPASGGAITTLVPNVDTISQIVEHAGTLFWTSASSGTVSKLSLAPGSSRGVLALNQTSPLALAVDDTWVYFGTSTALKRIHQ